MEELNDPLLEGKGVSDRRHEAVFSSLKKKELDIVVAYIELIWKIKGADCKEVPVGTIIENTKKYFSSDLLQVQDALWIQHCASSLRGLFDDLVIPKDLIKSLSCLPPETQNDGTETLEYIKIRQYNDFFNSIVHFLPDKALKDARGIIGDDSLEEVSDEVFEKVCRSFFQELFHLFSTYCMKPSTT